MAELLLCIIIVCYYHNYVLLLCVNILCYVLLLLLCNANGMKLAIVFKQKQQLNALCCSCSHSEFRLK